MSSIANRITGGKKAATKQGGKRKSAIKPYPAKPSAPAANASKSAHDNYAKRMIDWADKCREIDSENAATKAAQQQTKELKGLKVEDVLTKRKKR